MWDVLYLIGVLVKPLTVLPTIPLRIHHPLQKNARSVFGVACAFVERLLNSETCIEADTVKEAEAMQENDHESGTERVMLKNHLTYKSAKERGEFGENCTNQIMK